MLLDDIFIHNYAILGYSCAEHAQTDAFTGPLFNFTPTVRAAWISSYSVC